MGRRKKKAKQKARTQAAQAKAAARKTNQERAKPARSAAVESRPPPQVEKPMYLAHDEADGWVEPDYLADDVVVRHVFDSIFPYFWRELV